MQPGETATAEKNEYYDAGADKTAKIPVGFTVSDVEGETSINDGLVVYAPDGSEYVWIPVDGIIGEDGDLNDVNAENIADRKILLGRYVFKSDGTVDTTEGTTPATLGGQLKESSSSSYYFTEDTTGNGNAVATGEATDGTNNDVRCNIYDMAGNCLEWTTESSSDSDYPCVRRGGNYYNSLGYTSCRNFGYTTYSNSYSSFRSLLYL